MSAQIITLIQPMTEAEAWQKYAELAAMLSGDVTLLVNREFHIEMLRAHQRWAELFMAEDGL